MPHPITTNYSLGCSFKEPEFEQLSLFVSNLEYVVAQQRNRFEATVAELKKEIAGVVARSKDQGEQPVRGQVELKNAAARRVARK